METKHTVHDKLVEALELAEYKIGEMLMVGDFEPSHAENFQRARDSIKLTLEACIGKQ